MGGTGFIRKKVQSLTLGEYLTKVRSEAQISIEDVAHYTKIQLKYLEALEKGDYRDLPAEVYVRGFLRSYAAYLGIPEDPVLKLYQREKGIQENINGDLSEPPSAVIEPLRYPRFAVTSKMIVSVGVVLAIFGGFFYLYRQVEKFIATPQLTILSPINNTEVTVDEVTVDGVTEPEARVIINQQPVLVDENGKFQEKVLIQPGLNTIVITARNKFEKEVTKSVSVDAKFTSDIPENGEQNSSGINSADDQNNSQ